MDGMPVWMRELDTFRKIKPMILLEGHIMDEYISEEIGQGSYQLLDFLRRYFLKLGYDHIIYYDSISGFSAHDKSHLEGFANTVGIRLEQETRNINAPFQRDENSRHNAVDYIRTAMNQGRVATTIIMNLASRYIISPDSIEQCDVDSFTVLQQAAVEAKDVYRSDGRRLKNLVILIVNKSNDVPVWFYHNNPNIKVITITPPSWEERERLIKSKPYYSTFISEEQYGECVDDLDRFVALTDGFGYSELKNLQELYMDESEHLRHNFCDVIGLYKYGIRDNPWDRIDRAKINKEYFSHRVKGQEVAIEKTLDVIKRSITGLSGLQSSSRTKPKGVLFFAGPTGTGKTETAKTIAEILFGDESCCVRFDMSEYSQSHSDQRLLGAPPGYVGYESGGQLTNEIKKNPFSVLLFDEIEKAHPSIMDKFLQILDDGRMTDGQGNTVYFSESIIIFTTNLGIIVRQPDGSLKQNVTRETESYAEVSNIVCKAIEDYFKLQLGRPEILNRIGENIVVFDFIRNDVAKEILEVQIRKIQDNLENEKHIQLEIADEAKNCLYMNAIENLDNGGRGIGNVVESLLINPLARYLFDHEDSLSTERKIVIKSIDAESIPPRIECVCQG